MPFVFNNNYIEAFKELKDWLTSSLILCYYNPDLKSILETDASDKVVVGVLSQLHLNGEWYPIAFFLKIMALAKCNYEVHNKEILAIIQLLSQWRVELGSIDSWIKIYTDYKALKYFITTKQLIG